MARSCDEHLDRRGGQHDGNGIAGANARPRAVAVLLAEAETQPAGEQYIIGRVGALVDDLLDDSGEAGAPRRREICPLGPDRQSDVAAVGARLRRFDLVARPEAEAALADALRFEEVGLTNEI